MEWFTPEILLAFATLTVLEVVLGIDNLVFLSVISQRLEPESQAKARRFGLLLALALRIVLLLALSWLAGLTAPLFEAFGRVISARDLVLAVGGVFLLYKATTEIHAEIEGSGAHASLAQGKAASFASVIAQIAIIDMVFSIDSVLTAIGMVDQVPVMVAAIVVSIIVMLLAAEPVSGFVERHPTVKMLALSFLMLIGVALVADGLHFHIPRGYLYFAISFSILVETLSQLRSRRRGGGGESTTEAH